MTLIIAGVAYGQGTPTQTITVGVAFVQFNDAPGNVEARGGVGYTAAPRDVDDDKYLAQYWHNFFFQEEGHIRHPDSLTHLDVWSGDWAGYQLGSLARWTRENSYGRHRLEAYMKNGKNGILNSIDGNGKIEWIQLDKVKSSYASTQSMSNPLAMATEAKLDSIFEGLPDPPTSACDIIIIVYAGLSFGTYYSMEPPGYIGFPEKSSYMASYPDAILNLSMTGMVHEYIHAASDDLLDANDHPAGFIKDYGNDMDASEKRRARWIGLTAMKGHGTPNRPMHLDPWAKLLLGWIDYQILDAGEYHDISLPIIAQPADGVIPHVLIIPIDVPWTAEEPDWYRGHYLIVENRRRIPNSFDMTVSEPPSPGGFLVWEYDERLILNERGGLTLVEADGNYDMKFKSAIWIESNLPSGQKAPERVFLPTASDFWSEPAVLSTWSRHLLGMLDPTTMFNNNYAPDVVKTVPRQITIRFGEYEDVGDENVIPYISVGIPTSNISTATKNNNQSKLIKDGDKLVFVATADYSGDAEQGKITVFESLDNGQTWNDVSFMNDIDIYELPTWDPTWDPSSFTPEFQGVNPWKPAVVESGAAAPAIARIEGSWGVVWQQKVAAGESRVFFSLPSGAPVDLAGANIERTDDAVTPVIAYGKLDPANDPMLAVVYSTDYGLYRIVSTDGGATWPDPVVDPPVHVDGTGSSSINPSLAMSEDHEVLVYEEQEAIKIIIDGGAPIDLSALHPEFLRNLTPSLSVSGSTAHVVWAAEVEEVIPEVSPYPVQHIKPVHKVVNLDAGSDDNVASFINVKYGRLETAQRPVIAAKYQESDPLPASIAWSVFDQTEGARLRYNDFRLNSTTNQFEWMRKSLESPFSNVHTYHPAIAADQGDAKYIVTRGDESPYRIQLCSIYIPPQLDDSKHIGDRETAISVLDLPSGQWQNRVLFGQPKQYDNIGLHIGTLDVGGIPAIGFDGSNDGPRISALSRTPKFLLQQDDIVTWQVQVSRLIGNIYDDTSNVRLDMYDPISQQVIASSAAALLPPDKIDSVMVFTLQLPPSHYPADSVTLSINIEGDAYDSGGRYYTAVHNIFCDEAMPKSHREVGRQIAPRPRQAAVQVFPQPAGNSLHVTLHETPSSDVQVYLHDRLGRRVLHRTVHSNADGFARFQLDISGLRSGVYILRTECNGRASGRTVSIVR